MAVANIFILALTIIIWEVNSQKCGGSILVNPLRPPLEEESPIFANPLRPSFAKNPSFPKVSLPMANKLPITGITLSELTTPRFKAPSFSATCVSSESLLPLTVKTNLSSTALDEIDNSQSLLSNSGQDIIIPLSSEKPIKFYGPLNVEMNNLPLIKPNFALPCDTVSNLVDIEPPILPNLIANSNPVSLFNKTPMTNLIPTTRGLKYILDSSNNISPHYKTFQSSQSKPSAESVASATSSISPSLGQSSSSASTINVNSFQPNQVHQSPYSSNIFNCPENDPTCSFTSVPPLAPCDLPALNDADSSSLITSTSAASLMSSGQVNPNLVYPYISNLTPALYQPSTSMQSSSTAFSSGNAQLNPYQLNPFSSHIYGCPEIDPICFHTSVPPLSTNLSYQPSVNVAEATSAVSTGPKQASSSSSSSVNVDSYNYGQENSVLPSSYLSYRLPSSSQSSVNVAESTTSVASGSTKASSLTSSSTDFSQINSNLVDPFSSYMSACPEADPTYSYTSVPPLSTAPCYQSSENVAKATSSVSTGPTQASSSSSSTINVDSYNTGPVNSVFSSPYLSHSLSSPSQSSVNIAESTTSRASGLRQGSSSSSAYLLSDNSQIAPFSPYIYGCPVSDPTYSHTSIAPLPTTSVAHSFVDIAQRTSSGSPSLEQAVFSSSSLNLNPYNTPANSILFTPYSNYVNTGAVTAPSQSSTSIAKTKNTVVAGLGQASSAASSGNIATGPFSPSSYLLNTIACPDTDSTCSFTSVQPVSADQSSVNGADSYSPNVFGSPVQYSSNVVEAKSSISSSTGQDYSSTSFVNNDEITSRRDSPSTYNSNVFSCPNTDLTCSFFSVPPVSEVPTYQSSVNVAESSSLTTSDLESLSSSSFGANQVISNTAKPYPINIAGCPDFDSTCLYTSVNPVASNKMNQPSVGISEASSLAEASSSASSISVNSFASEDSTPYQSNTYNYPDTDPTCSFTSVPPVSEALPNQSSYLGSRSSSSFVANQDSSNTLNPYSANIAGCPSFDPTCSFTSVKPVPPTAFYQPSVGLAEISSATSSGSGHISPLSSPYLNPSVIEQASPSLSTFSLMPQFVFSTPQSKISLVETASSISSNSVQTVSTTSSTNLDAPSTTLNNDNINNLPGIYSASSTETSVPKITSSSSVSKTVSASSNTPSAPAAVDNHIGVPQNTLTSVVENTAASFTDSSSPINTLTASSSSSTTTTDVNSLADKSVPQLLLNNPLSVVEISSSSSTISSPTKVLTDSPSISITSADTTSLVDQSPTSLSGQKTQVSKSATSLLSTPTSISMPLPSTYPSKLALSMSAPEFNLGINPLTLKVEIPSTIMSSIVTSNVPRAYGPHSIKIPSYIPAQLSCTLRS